MRLFSYRDRPVHLGPYPLERLRRTHAAPDCSALPPMQAHQLRSQSAEGGRRTLFAGKLHGGVEILEQRAHVPFHRFKLALGHLRGEDLQRF